MMLKISRVLFLTILSCLSTTVYAGQLVDGKVETKLVPGPVEYSVLLPDGYDATKDQLPLLLLLHGGGGDKSFLKNMKPMIEEMWNAKTLPPMVVATPSAGRSFYMDYKDGSQKWETFIVTDFLNHLRETYKVTKERKGTILFGISMGGMGALRMAFKYPEKFAGLAALEPGIDPALKWKDVKPRNRFWRAQDLMEAIFGKPMDEQYWELNNPASIAAANPEKLRNSGLSIYLDCGDEDAFNLHEATEFMHRVLWDNRINHEYHLVRGANHLGRTLRPRSIEGLAFLQRVLNPPPPDPQAENLIKQLEPLKRMAEKP
ncbi:MAG: alpha/beta hydrolase [Acidobacteria bacterium]|nr:alpha/beta hydrolase [Acidobacteriota bacterium]